MLEEYFNKNKEKSIDEFNRNNNNANNSSAIEDTEIKSILSDIQNHINQAFEKNEIKTQEDLLFYKELIKRIEFLLKSPVDKSNDKNTTKTAKLQKTSSRSNLKDDNKINSFTENNNKFCKFLEDNNIGNSNVEALQPYNISNKPFIIKGKTFFLSKQQIKYLADIKSLLLTEKRPELTREPVIINGVPGSGKSHLTKLITEEKENLESLLKQIDERAIGQLKYEAKELNYCEFYNYKEGEVSAKTNVEIKAIIDRKISDENSKLFLMVDEWGGYVPTLCN